MDKDTLQEYEKTYNEIISFYDFAEKLVNTVEDAKVTNPTAQLDFIEPIVRQIEEATDILSEEYRNFVRTGKKPGFFSKKRVEKSLRKIYEALYECKQNAK